MNNILLFIIFILALLFLTFGFIFFNIINSYYESSTCLEEAVRCYKSSLIFTKPVLFNKVYGNCSDVQFNLLEKECISWRTK